MENVAQFWNSVFTTVSNAMNATAAWPLWLAAAVLLILAIVLICLVAARTRKCGKLNEALQKAEQEAGEIQEENRRNLDECEARMEEALYQKDRMLDEQKEEAQRLRQDIDELTQFKERYVQIPDAEVEANRIIQEAKNRAYYLREQTELEYAQAIEHANQEAEAVHQAAQQRLERSHETLKAALAYAHEIVEDAQTQAMRISGMTFAETPDLIESPDNAPARDYDEEQETMQDEKTETENTEILQEEQFFDEDEI